MKKQFSLINKGRIFSARLSGPYDKPFCSGGN